MNHTDRVAGWKSILKMAWPLIVANSFWNLQITIDRILLGHYSTEALAATMTVMGIFWAPMALLQQTAAYLTTFIAQYFGAKRHEMIGPAVWQSIYVSVVGGVLLLGMIPLAEVLFDWVGHAESVRGLEVEYFKSICHSGLPTALVAAASAYFTGLGNTKIIIGINCVGLVANAILSYLMIFGHFGFPAMGVAGAGYATSIATWLSAFYGLFLVFRSADRQTYRLREGWSLNLDLMKRYIRFGLPSGLQWALEGLAFTIFLVVIGRLSNGSAALAASGIVVTLMMLAVLPALGVAQAVSVLVGQHLGEKKPEEAAAASWSGFQVAIMYIMSVGVTFVAFPNFYLQWFYNPQDPTLWGQVQVIVPYLLMFVALFTAFDSMNLVFSFALKGAGDTKFVSLVALILPWPLMVLPTWLFRDFEGAVYWAWGAASLFGITQALVFWRRFVGGRWKQMSVIN